MAGGMHGGRDMNSGAPIPGWHACGLEVTTQADPERTWAALSAG